MPEKRYRKRPVEITALKWNGTNLQEATAFLGQSWIGLSDDGAILLPTLHGVVPCEVDAWICRGPRDFWPVEDATFAETYEPIAPAPSREPGTEAP